MSYWIGIAWCPDCMQVVDVYFEDNTNKAKCGFCDRNIPIEERNT